MNLTEYLNQTEPQRMPFVELQDGEFITHNTIKTGQETLTAITIPALWEKYKVNGYYVQKNNDRRLYVQDENGMPKGISCFNLPKNQAPNEL